MRDSSPPTRDSDFYRAQRCCWPECQDACSSTAISPLCDRHLLKSYRTVRAGLDARMVKPTAAKPRRDRGVVYFIRFRDRIKIGFTTDLRRRLTDLPHHEVLLTQDGTMADEQRCHALFAHLRDVGEWFRAERDLLDFIEGCKH